MIGAFVVAAGLMFPVATPAWCGPVRVAVTDDVGLRDDARWDAAVAALPDEALRMRVLGDVGRQGTRAGGLLTLAHIAHAACDDASSSALQAATPSADADALARLAQDPRFVGVRRRADATDRALERVWVWLQGLFATRGMQTYANNARAIYLVALVVSIAVVGVRLWRRRRMPQAPRGATHDGRSVQVLQRVRIDVAALRARAAACLRDGDARGAVCAAQQALCLRLALDGAEPLRDDELAARTSREWLVRLDAPRADVVAPVFAAFDRTFFAGPCGLAQARAFVALVDAGLERLPRAALAPPQPAGDA